MDHFAPEKTSALGTPEDINMVFEVLLAKGKAKGKGKDTGKDTGKSENKGHRWNGPAGRNPAGKAKARVGRAKGPWRGGVSSWL